MTISPVRGRVYMADLGNDKGEKPYLVISNNARNAKLGDCLAVRLTTTLNKPDIPSIVRLEHHEPLAGLVLCDDIVNLYKDELKRDVGALSAGTMSRVRNALMYALAL
jgi:mRNA interferase MazF